MNEMNLSKLLLLVKLIVVYLLSIVSFFMTDLMVCFGIIAGGINPITFILIIITRAGLAILISCLFFGIQVLNNPKLEIDFILAMIIFGVPIMSFIEAIPYGIITLPLPPYVSLMQATLTMALLYEFPRLILLIIIKHIRVRQMK